MDEKILLLKDTVEPEGENSLGNGNKDSEINGSQTQVWENSVEANEPSCTYIENTNLFNGVEVSKLTKRQMKKYNKFLKWQDVKKDKRAKEREKKKEKRKYAKQHEIDIGPSRKELKRKKMELSSCKIAVCIDLSFDNLMIDKDNEIYDREAMKTVNPNFDDVEVIWENIEVEEEANNGRIIVLATEEIETSEPILQEETIIPTITKKGNGNTFKDEEQTPKKKDMAKTVKQILRIYTENRRAKAPMQLHLSGFSGRSKEEMSRHNGYQHWDINFHESHYLDIFPKDKLIYLTSDSENIINTLEDDKIYIIGGLVDHNGHKGICYKKAVEEGIAHGQLPIGEYFWMKQRKVLTINQVFEILIRVSEGKSFKEAFELILPKRKEIILLENTREEIDNS